MTTARRSSQFPEAVIVAINDDSDDSASIFFIGIRQLAETLKGYVIKPSLQVVHPEAVSSVTIASSKARTETIKLLIDLV